MASTGWRGGKGRGGVGIHRAPRPRFSRYLENGLGLEDEE